jgi:UbiD family decarboxylase
MTIAEKPPTSAVPRYRDLREWLERVDALGELKRIDGAHWKDEIGPIAEINAKQPRSYALLFDNIPGYPSGFRVVSACANTARRLALTLRLPANNTTELVSQFRGGRISSWQAQSSEFPPQEVSDGPVFECSQEGGQVDIEAFPTPIWHELDGGRYIGTACAVITRDPDTGWTNAGAYRNMVTGKNQISLWMATRNRHGRLHLNKYWERGEPAPVVVTFGQDPLLSPILAGMETRDGVSELNMAGAIMGEPLQVVRGPITGLPIPAHAEIAFEGWVRQGVETEEGPHGEGPGYYAGGKHMVPAIEIAAVYHRRNPILVGSPPGKPPHDYSYSSCVMRSALVHDALEAAGLPGVVRVWCPPSGSARLMNVVVLKQRYFGHSKQAGLLATQVQPAAYLGRLTVVVDEDINPEDLGELFWAITTRADPKRDYTILEHCWGSPIDPLNMLYPEGTMYTNRVVIDACRPFEHLQTFPPVAASSPELLAKTWDKWGHLFEKRA